MAARAAGTGRAGEAGAACLRRPAGARARRESAAAAVAALRRRSAGAAPAGTAAAGAGLCPRRFAGADEQTLLAFAELLGDRSPGGLLAALGEQGLGESVALRVVHRDARQALLALTFELFDGSAAAALEAAFSTGWAPCATMPPACWRRAGRCWRSPLHRWSDYASAFLACQRRFARPAWTRCAPTVACGCTWTANSTVPKRAGRRASA